MRYLVFSISLFFLQIGYSALVVCYFFDKYKGIVVYEVWKVGLLELFVDKLEQIGDLR
jgi:hypothetical protein